MKKENVIELSGIIKSYGTEDFTVEILHGISLAIANGEFIAISGPSGSGKSTLLNILGLLDNATQGSYFLRGKDVTRLTEDEQAHVRNAEIGFVFQSFNLLQRTSALENVILPSIYAGTKRVEREVRAKELLTQVGLADHMHKRPNQLSGGQQQRVAIARSLMNNPAIILADEPTGNLDSKSGADVMGIIKDLNKQGKTIIMITHDPHLAKQAKRAVYIRDGLLSE
jgi:putative ABC transport system ATP-binding protein